MLDSLESVLFGADESCFVDLVHWTFWLCRSWCCGFCLIIEKSWECHRCLASYIKLNSILTNSFVSSIRIFYWAHTSTDGLLNFQRRLSWSRCLLLIIKRLVAICRQIWKHCKIYIAWDVTCRRHKKYLLLKLGLKQLSKGWIFLKVSAALLVKVCCMQTWLGNALAIFASLNCLQGFYMISTKRLI